MKPLSIYIHIPFCVRKCAYCDFASWPDREADWRRYFDALMDEIRLWSVNGDFGLLSERYRIHTAFIGGGTPTLVNTDHILEALEACRGIAPFEESAEITIEGNPGTLTPDKLTAYRKAGVNRLSLGAQSFDDGLLCAIGRIHSAAQIGEAVSMAREAGFENINLDLMYGLPEQSMDLWRETLDMAIRLNVPHISAYSLIVEPGTPMASRVARGAAILPEDDAVNAMQREATRMLTEVGFERYEISNYAKPGHACRHNLTYWRRGDYLGLGCAAHSMLNDTRFCNPSDLDAYLGGVRGIDAQHLTQGDIKEETIMLSTRTARGIDLKCWRERFGRPFERGRARTLSQLVKSGLIELTDGFLRLTERGMEVQDAVVLELLEEQEA